MTTSDDMMRQKLLGLREQLQSIAAISEQSSAVVELDQSKVGRLSRMDAMQAQAMAQAADQRRETSLRNISAALSRLDKGEFGVCRQCDVPINPKRLEFDPTVVYCVDCASETEAQY